MLSLLLSLPAHASPQAATGDFDGDNLTDQATVDGHALEITYGFDPNRTFGATSDAVAVATGDADQDGYDDVLLVSTRRARLLYGSATGLRPGGGARVDMAVLQRLDGVIADSDGDGAALEEVDEPVLPGVVIYLDLVPTTDDVVVDGNIIVAEAWRADDVWAQGWMALVPGEDAGDAWRDGKVLVGTALDDPQAIQAWMANNADPVPLFPVEIREVVIRVTVEP